MGLARLNSFAMTNCPTSYHFEITTPDEIMEVFGTVMSHSPEGVVLDLWCPEEPCLNHRITTTGENIPQVVKTLLQDDLAKMLPEKNGFSIRYLPY